MNRLGLRRIYDNQAEKKAKFVKQTYYENRPKSKKSVTLENT